MALELIGAIALGFMAAGLALLALRLSRGRLPRALVPISAASTAIIAMELNTAPNGSVSSTRGSISGEWMCCGMKT